MVIQKGSLLPSVPLFSYLPFVYSERIANQPNSLQTFLLPTPYSPLPIPTPYSHSLFPTPTPSWVPHVSILRHGIP
jgi:hypothetical protein